MPKRITLHLLLTTDPSVSYLARVGKNPKNLKNTCEVFGLLGFWWVFEGFWGFSRVFGVFLSIKFQNKKSRQNIKEKYIYYINYKL